MPRPTRRTPSSTTRISHTGLSPTMADTASATINNPRNNIEPPPSIPEFYAGYARVGNMRPFQRHI